MTHSKSCLGVDNCTKLVKDLRAHNSNGKKDGMFRSIQKKLLDSMSKANPKDRCLFRVIKLICDHNIPITKVRDKSFMDLLGDIEPTSYETVVATMLELAIIIEEKIAREIKGRKGSILHDGWSRYGVHYVALMACYMIDWGEDEDGNRIEKPEITLISCSTLPYHDEADDEDADTECTYLIFICLLMLYNL